MATIIKSPSGTWRVQVRRKGQYIAETFRRRHDADEWALQMECKIDRGELVSRVRPKENIVTVADLIDTHIADMTQLGKPLRRSKRFSLKKLRTDLGNVRIDKLDRERIIKFGRERAKEGAGAVTIGMDISYLKTIALHASAVHGADVSVEQIQLGRAALNLLGLIGRSGERDRRPTDKELTDLIAFFSSNERQVIPMDRIIQFAVATAMRQSEICTIKWADLDERKCTALVRDRKDPRKKVGNNQYVPLVNLTGFDAMAVIREQKKQTGNRGRIFPYDSKSVGAAFRRGCRVLSIEDLHFHDLRHEATSRLFEAGLQIQQVALVTGHKDWKMLKRYTHLTADSIVALANKNKYSAP
ncbi:site-specific integrase [Parvularcula sp. IMCC14364]|uniref:site-specific integrase n=1 Tax=Parvularcula sp. IMCC14364 TaxID=3067902 RepID=UPI002740BA01|nr:site-specific integrase [Parvularcula sp. IMCC14364]